MGLIYVFKLIVFCSCFIISYSEFVHLNLPIAIKIYSFSTNELNINGDERQLILRILQNTLDSYHPDYDKTQVRFHLNYDLVEGVDAQGFITKYGEYIKDNSFANDESLYMIPSHDISTHIHDIVRNHVALSSSFSSYSIFIIPRGFASLLPKHKFIDADGNEISLLQPQRGHGYAFIDLSSTSSIISFPKSKLNDISMLSAGVTQAIKSFLIPSSSISDFILSSSSLFLPIVSLRRLNFSTIHDPSLTSTTTMMLPDMKRLSDWFDAHLLSLNTQSLSFASANYFIDEHPQMAVALSSSLTISNTSRIIVNQKLLANDIIEAGDYFCDQLLDRSGLRSDIEFQLSYDNENLRLYKERLHKEHGVANKNINMKTFKGEKKMDSIDALLWDKHLKIAHRKHGIIPVFVITNIHDFYPNTSTSASFETGSFISVMHDMVLVLDTEANRHAGISIDVLAATGILQALTGVKLTLPEISALMMNTAASDIETALSWETKRSVLVQRSLRLLRFLDTASTELSSHVTNALLKLKVIPDASYMMQVNMTELLSLSKEKIYEVYRRIASIQNELSTRSKEIKQAFLSMISSSEDYAKIHEVVYRISGSLDELLMKVREVQDQWNESLVDATVSIDEAVLTMVSEVAADTVAMKSSKSRSSSITRYAVIVILVVALGYMTSLAHQRISTRAKKLR